jgi:hypothetical protein
MEEENVIHKGGILESTWCGYEVPEMILLCNLKGAIQLDHNKDMPVYVLYITLQTTPVHFIPLLPSLFN